MRPAPPCPLQAAGLAVAIVNPRQARDFAGAMGHDRIDALAWAELARVLDRHPAVGALRSGTLYMATLGL